MQKSAPQTQPQAPQILMTPGPVPLPPEVLQILAEPMVHHRTPAFEALFARTLENLKAVFKTKQPVFIHTSAGTGAMESAIVNTCSPGDNVICIVSGKFGERWAEMCKIYGLTVHKIIVPWGQPVTVAQVEQSLKAHPDAKAVFTQACETSTAVLHPIREMAAVVAKTPALFIVDAITALGALPLPMDEWQLDVVIGGSQKAFMLPTGLAFISLSEKAWAAYEQAKCPRFYFDLGKEKKANATGESAFSSAVTHIRALDGILNWVGKRGGLNALQQRIASLAEATRLSATAMGLRVFAQAPAASVTAILLPEDIDGQKVRARMESHYNVVVMGGQDQLKGKIIRIGHMGAISNNDMIVTMHALASSLNDIKPGTVSADQTQAAVTALETRLR